MCDVKKYQKMKDEFYKLSYQDFMQLIDESEDKESKKFFVDILNSITQSNQAKVIKKGIY